MGFTTTFLALGEQANRLLRGGERVCLVTKTRYKARAVSHADSLPETTKDREKKTAKKTQAKKAKAPHKKKKAPTAKDDVEDLSDDFDDVVEVVQPATTQYPLIPVSKSVGRYVLLH